MFGPGDILRIKEQGYTTPGWLVGWTAWVTGPRKLSHVICGPPSRVSGQPAGGPLHLASKTPARKNEGLVIGRKRAIHQVSCRLISDVAMSLTGHRCLSLATVNAGLGMGPDGPPVWSVARRVHE